MANSPDLDDQPQDSFDFQPQSEINEGVPNQPAQIALQRLEERLRMVTEAAQVYWWELDLQTNSTRYSTNTEQIIGSPPAKSIEENLLLLHPDDRHLPSEAFEFAQKNGTDSFQYVVRSIAIAAEIRWLHVKGTLFRDAQGHIVRAAGITQNITSLKQAELALRESEEQKAFLLNLSDVLRPLADPIQIQAAAVRLLGEHLGANQVHYGEIIGEDVIIHQGYGNRLPPMVGRFRSVDLGQKLTATHQAGHVQVIKDVETDPLNTEAERQVLRAAHIGAYIIVPLLKEGNCVATLAVHSINPRNWTAQEVELIRETAERTWTAVERAHAQEDLRKSEQRSSFLLQLADSLRPLDNPVSIQYQAARVLGEFLGANRIGYAINQENEKLVAVTLHYTHGVPGIEGVYRYIDYGPDLLRDMRTGKTVVRPDIAHDPTLSDVEKTAHAHLQLGATVNVPLLKQGRLLAILFVHFQQAHDWSADEVTLIEETAERIWNAVERARMEEALRKSEEEYRLLGIASSDSIYKMSPDWAQMHQLTGKAFLADTADPNSSWLEAYIPIEDQPQVQQVIREAILTQSPFEMEHRVLRANGTVGWTFSRAIPVLDEQGAILEWLGAASDVTDRKQAEASLQQADRRKDEFLAMLAHELRNPLATVRNGLTILNLTMAEADSMSGKALVMMNRQVDQLVRMVDDLLDISRVSQNKIELKRERVELGALVMETVLSMHPQYVAQSKMLNLLPAPFPLFVEGDSTRLSQIVTNLLTNGLRYTGEQGQVRVSLEASQNQALIRIADNGIGLGANELTAIFELFMQGKTTLTRQQGGLGIGLTLAKRLVELHGGRLEAHSPGLGEGSEFIVYLPLLDLPQDKTDSTENVPFLTESAHRILVIDDNADAALSLSMMLKLYGYEVYSQLSGQEGIKTAEALRPAIILCDISMPGMDGFETARRIRQEVWGQSIRLIALTGYGQAEDKQRTKEAGFDDHLVKPVDIDDLISLLGGTIAD